MLEHQDYLEAVRELTDWLMTAGEELQHWSETSRDSSSIKKKLSEVRVRKIIRVYTSKEMEIVYFPFRPHWFIPPFCIQWTYSHCWLEVVLPL